MEALTRKQRRSGLLTLIFLLLAVALVIVPIVGMNGGGAVASSPRQSTPSAIPSGTPTPTCNPAYKQVAVKHDSNRVDSEFAQKYAEATLNANNLTDAQTQLLLKESGQNAQVLATWSYAAGLFDDAAKWPTLVAGDCLSAEGQKLHDMFEGVLKAKGTTVEAGEAPPGGYNSGISNGVYGVDSLQGVTGDRKAIKITLANGTTFWIMVRCGNPVFPGKPKLPPVPTDTERCQFNPALPPDSPDCLEQKGDSINNQWSQAGLDQQTNGQVSQEQKASGQTSGNTTDHTVSSGTTSGSTSTDMGSNGGTTSSTGSTAPGASPGGDSQSAGTPSSAPTDPTGSQNTGGTNGQTCVPTPVHTCP